MIFGKTNKQIYNEAQIWRRWFAWFPVVLEDGRLAWLSWIERRWHGVIAGEELFGYYDYRSKP